MSTPLEPGARIGNPAADPVRPPVDPDLDDGVDMGDLDLEKKPMTDEERKVAKAARQAAHLARQAKWQADKANRRRETRIQTETRDRFYKARKVVRGITRRDVVRTEEGYIDEAKSGTAENWSYRAYSLEKLKESLGFEAAADAPAEPAEGETEPGAEKASRQSKAELALHQTNADHAAARALIHELATVRYEVDRERIRAAANAAFNDFSDYRANPGVIKSIRVQDGQREGTVFDRMDHFWDGLEDERLEVINDAVEWFKMRCVQAETLMQSVTARKNLEEDLGANLSELDDQEELSGLMEQLDLDVTFFESLEQLTFEGTSGFKGKMKGLIGKHIWNVKKARQKVNTTRDTIIKAAAVDKEGYTEVDIKKNKIFDLLLDMGPRFIQVASEKTIGMSPDQERDYWESIFDRLMDAAPFIKGESPKDRLLRIHHEVGLLVKKDVGGSQKTFLKRAEPGTAIAKDFEHIHNVDELLAVAEEEAKMLGVLRKRMSFPKAVLGPGPEGRRTITNLRKLMRGKQNEDRIAMVDLLNKALGAKQTEALAALDAADEEFKTLRTNRLPTEWSKNRKNNPDAVLKEKLRAKMYELLDIGTPEQPQFEALAPIMKLPDDPEVLAARAATEQQRRAVEQQEKGGGTYYDQIRGSDQGESFVERFRAAVGAEVAATAGITKGSFRIFRVRGERLLHGLEPKQSSAFVTAMKQALEAVRPAPELADVDLAKAEGKYVQVLSQFFLRCEQVRALLGPQWATEAGVIVELPGASGFSVDTAKLDAAVAEVKDDVRNTDFVDAFGLTEGNGQAVLLNTVSVELKPRLASLGATPKNIAEVALLSVPGEPHMVASFNLNERIEAMVKVLEADLSGTTWQERLVNTKLATLQGETLVYDVRAIRRAMMSVGNVERIEAASAK